MHFSRLQHLIFIIIILILFLRIVLSRNAFKCPIELNYKIVGANPSPCELPIDPNELPSTTLERWFTNEMFEDLFPFSNLGWGPNPCSPYSFEAFKIAVRYFPRFGDEISLNNSYTPKENSRRDVANFFAHAIQETGLNDISVYQISGLSESQADECFFRGGLYNWFEGGPISALLAPSFGTKPEDGNLCTACGRLVHFENKSTSTDTVLVRHSMNVEIALKENILKVVTLGEFGEWLKTQNISADLLNNPNLVITKKDPPLALLASLWFYMTPQPPKPAMHDIILGQWNAGLENEAAGYSGSIFGPTNLIINNECTGEDPKPPGGGGENRRIRAFKWLCHYFNVSVDRNEKTLTYMLRRFDQMPQNVSWEPDWSTTWRQDNPCKCTPATYAGLIPYYQPGFYPDHFINQNNANRQKCEEIINGRFAKEFGLDSTTSGCLNYTINTIIENQNNKSSQYNHTESKNY